MFEILVDVIVRLLHTSYMKNNASVIAYDEILHYFTKFLDSFISNRLVIIVNDHYTKRR